MSEDTPTDPIEALEPEQSRKPARKRTPRKSKPAADVAAVSEPAGAAKAVSAPTGVVADPVNAAPPKRARKSTPRKAVAPVFDAAQSAQPANSAAPAAAERLLSDVPAEPQGGDTQAGDNATLATEAISKPAAKRSPRKRVAKSTPAADFAEPTTSIASGSAPVLAAPPVLFQAPVVNTAPPSRRSAGRRSAASTAAGDQASDGTPSESTPSESTASESTPSANTPSENTPSEDTAFEDTSAPQVTPRRGRGSRARKAAVPVIDEPLVEPESEILASENGLAEAIDDIDLDDVDSDDVDSDDIESDDIETEDSEDDDEDGAGVPASRRRRRRGRRGRGPRPVQDDAPAADSDEDESASDEDDEDDESALSPSARRRRRRRRSTATPDAEISSDDPPNTEVHVREPKSGAGRGSAADADGVRGIKGSTRLEAKRQRRRDSRDTGRRRAPILTEAEFLTRRESVERVMAVRQVADRTQIAVLEDGILVEHYVTRASAASAVGNVYLGRVQNVLPSMEAAFIDIGRGRNGVLYAGEVNWDAAGLDGKSRAIEHAMSSGDPVLVQVTKDPIGHKGARLTSQISLPGRFVVYVPGGGMTGISRKLPDTERTRLKSILKKVVPEDAGVIVRTAAEGASEEDLVSDVTGRAWCTASPTWRSGWFATFSTRILSG
jgi:ribonuclease E